MAKIDIAAWLDAGKVMQTEAPRFAETARRELGGLRSTGGQGGIPGFDQMIAGVLPAVLDAVEPTITGISENLAAEGGSLIETGEAYKEIRAEVEDMDEEEEW